MLDSKLLTHLYGTKVQVVTTPQGAMFVTPNMAEPGGCDMHDADEVARFHHHGHAGARPQTDEGATR